MRMAFIPGQRWFSETEPELGLGMVLSATAAQVTVVFRATGTTRVYSIEHAPLKRLQFRAGDTVRGGQPEQELKVTEITEENGLIVYHSNGTAIPETLLSDQLLINTPRERLLAGHIDESAAFDLRARALQLLHESRRSPVRGFAGGRVALIPHQLYIAGEVTSRQHPRVLLADEVGLGKTIESCLILHRLLLTGRASRVLILVPESLVHQWFVELLRRFNLWFSIFDEERCASIEQHDPAANPFLDNQLILASVDLLAQKPARAAQALAATFDLMIVDEAHHLHWSPEKSSSEYDLVAQLAARTESVLLLTATPEQLGEASHFARLHILDPQRFSSLDGYLAEHANYEKVAGIAGQLIAGNTLSESDLDLLAAVLQLEAPALRDKLVSAREQIIQQLLDQHGTGRVMFRNTRAAMSGFPRRIAHLIPLSAPPSCLAYLQSEFLSDSDSHLEKPDYELEEDPRIVWLADFLRANPARKVLVLCRYLDKAEAIESALRDHLKTKAAVFHENLPLIQRDRNAAWFAEEDGAQVLICSEIGSEGRNFQFAHDLVLFDLPANPELLEQRIGRLDRIGQTEDIQIHVPVVTGSPQESIARWYHEGINAFEQHFSGGAEMHERFYQQLLHETSSTSPESFARFLQETAAFRAELEARLHAGRDRLLEMHSFNAARAREIAAQINTADADARLDAFLVTAFDHFGIHIEELGQRTFNLGAGDLFKDKIPALPEQGLTATSDRARALGREDIGFLTFDHPVVTSLLDMILGSEKGNSAFALWPNAPAAGVLIEAVYVLECIAPPALHLDRFLPPTPIRIVLNHKRKEIEADATPEVLAANLKSADAALLSAQWEELGSLLPGMIHVTEVIAGKRSKPILQAATEGAKTQLESEINRLQQLQRTNKSIRPAEIEAAGRELLQVQEHLAKATVRLDAVRLILASSGGAKAAAV